MGYLFDGEVGFGAAAVKGRARVLPRFLAVILFGLAAFVGIPTGVASIVALLTGDLRTLALMASVSPIVLICGWLGERLWSGKSVPRWLVVSVLLIGGLAGFAFLLLVAAAILVLPVIISL
ncbi:hypothetical protein [Paludisphaera borealis]|uniref:Uncharacterized protein n=1 Tax=Paludisphaera borealis TaxID=1387353 RepID=A0A1U7CZ12_9BACT|nr:hypothetical protein [Paludisphaera borealis]APW64151.1 hypothetical protein BSF38_05743 [Paludisphaera borealis]